MRYLHHCRPRTMATVVVMLLSTAMPVKAEDAETDQVFQQIRLYDTILRYPMPSWVDVTGDLLKQSEYSRQQKGNYFIFEQIPKGEAFDSWTALYAVAAVHKPDFSFKQFLGASIAQIGQKCGKSNLNYERLSQDESSAMLVIVCGSYAKADGQFGYAPDVGDVTVMRFDQAGATFIKTYHHWRGEKFDIEREENWPVRRRTVLDMANGMAAMELTVEPATDGTGQQ